MRVAVTPVPVVPSPKSQANVSGLPSGSVDVEASNEHTRRTHELVKAGTGGALTTSAVVTCRVSTEVASPSETVSVTVRVPGVAYVWAAVTPVAVVPSPKFQANVSGLPSGSVDVEASNEQSSPTHALVKAGVGGTFTGAPSLPGVIARENCTPRLTATEVVATGVPEIGPGTAAFESPTTRLTRPVPVAAAVVRETTSAGNVQVASVVDFSPQMSTSHEPAPARATAGAVWLVAEVLTTAASLAVSVGNPMLLR